MPELQEWVAALTQPRRIRVTSSDELVQEVANRQASRNAALEARGKGLPTYKPQLTPVQEFYPSLQIAIKPIDLLHAIGITTTPPVRNLADISSTWAIWRYIWAFAMTKGANNALRLSQVACDIDFHQKGLLSDEVGVGMAAYIMANYLGAPRAVDISVALRDPAWQLVRKLSTSPDYIFFDDVQPRTYIVECKGSQTSRNAALNQLRRGTEQVPSIKLSSGASLPSLVIGTHLNRTQTEVLILDPPADEQAEKGENSESRTGERVRKTGKRSFEVVDDPKFFEAMSEFNAAKVLAFSGDEMEAAAKIEGKIPLDRGRFLRRERPTRRVETNVGDFIGVSERIPMRDDVRLDVFRGVESGLKEIYANRGEEQRARNIVEFRDRLQQNRAAGMIGFESFEEPQDAGTVVRSISSQGTLFQVTLSHG